MGPYQVTSGRKLRSELGRFVILLLDEVLLRLQRVHRLPHVLHHLLGEARLEHGRRRIRGGHLVVGELAEEQLGVEGLGRGHEGRDRRGGTGGRG